MAGLVPAIHHLARGVANRNASDARDKPGHDDAFKRHAIAPADRDRSSPYTARHETRVPPVTSFGNDHSFAVI